MRYIHQQSHTQISLVWASSFNTWKNELIKTEMYFHSLIALILAVCVLGNQIDVLKISDVPFPTSGCCSIQHYAAAASAPMDTDIPEFSVCYRMLIDSYNDELLSSFGADIDGIHC